MTVKEKVFDILRNNSDEYISGESISSKLGVTRAGIWKAIKSLQNDGYNISAVNNKGYKLINDSDIISKTGIKSYLKMPVFNNITVFNRVDSTNKLLKELADNRAAEFTTVVAGTQTAGRGRYGRSFFSPSDTGIYLSLLLKPKNDAEKSTFITTAAAVAVCEAIEQLTDLKPGIKWVNDIFINGLKVCGILTEASFSVENNCFDYAVLGIGINIYTPSGGFPPELQSIAGSVLDKHRPDFRNKLIAALLDSFYRIYVSEIPDEYTEKYKSRCFVVGETVDVIRNGTTTVAKVTGIDSACRLELLFEDGHTDTLSSGEISVKIKQDRKRDI